VITDHGEKIAQELVSSSPRGVTLIDVTGVYTNTAKKMLFCALKESESEAFQKKILSIDSTAFIVFSANPLTKQIWIYDEHYQTKMLNDDIAKMIISKGYAKERIRADAAEPKTNDDLRRLGIVRIAPSVKGKDSIINGITAIQEYKIIVHPSCKNTISELSSYTWKKDKNENGLNQPEDRNNHLMDALRYAFYDVKTFRPTEPRKVRPTSDEYYNMNNGISPADLGGF
jgi:hypothetical protein